MCCYKGLFYGGVSIVCVFLFDKGDTRLVIWFVFRVQSILGKHNCGLPFKHTAHLPKSPEREKWMFLRMKNRRGLRLFSISTNLLLSCLPWCVYYHRKRLLHFVYLTSFNIKAQLKCCNESWISLLWRLWALTHTYTLTHLHMWTHTDAFILKRTCTKRYTFH